MRRPRSASPAPIHLEAEYTATPPDSSGELQTLRASCPERLHEYKRLLGRGHPDAAAVLLSLDPVLVLDAPFDEYAAALENALRLAPDAGPTVYSGLLRAHARFWTLRGGHRIARQAVVAARVVLSENTCAADAFSVGQLAFVSAHAEHGLGAVAEVEVETTALANLTLATHRSAQGPRVAALSHQAEGFLALSRGAPAVATCAFETAVDWSRRAGADRTLAIGLANQGTAQLAGDKPEAALVAFRQSLALFRGLGDRLHCAHLEGRLATLPHVGGPLDVAAVLRVVATSEGLGDPWAAAHLMLTLLERADRASCRTHGPAWVERTFSLLARVDAPTLEARAKRFAAFWGASSEGRARVLEALEDGSSAVLDGQTVSLRARRALPNVLRALVRARLETPGTYLSVSQVFDAGWPGERALPHAASARVYMAIRALRTLGLRAVIATSPSGYRIEPDVTVRLRQTDRATKEEVG